jgi:hypothetical protein
MCEEQSIGKKSKEHKGAKTYRTERSEVDNYPRHQAASHLIAQPL